MLFSTLFGKEKMFFSTLHQRQTFRFSPPRNWRSDGKATCQKQELQQKIDSETARTDEIKKLEEYKNTTEYVEGIAKDKLGLVYKDEIIFKPSN